MYCSSAYISMRHVQKTDSADLQISELGLQLQESHGMDLQGWQNRSPPQMAQSELSSAVEASFLLFAGNDEWSPRMENFIVQDSVDEDIHSPEIKLENFLHFDE